MYATIGVIGLTVTHMEQNYTMGSYEVIKGVTNIKDIVDTSNTYEQIYIDDDYEGIKQLTEFYIQKMARFCTAIREAERIKHTRQWMT